jgi:MIF4G domain
MLKVSEEEFGALEASNLRQLQLLDKMALANPEIASQDGEIVEDQKRVAQSLQNIMVIQDLFINYTQAVASQSSPSPSNDTESLINDTVKLFPETVQDDNYITRESIIETFLKAKEEASLKSERKVFISQSPCNLQKSKLVVVKTEFTSNRAHITKTEPFIAPQKALDTMPVTMPVKCTIGKRAIYNRDHLMLYRNLFQVWPVDIAYPIGDVSMIVAKSRYKLVPGKNAWLPRFMNKHKDCFYVEKATLDGISRTMTLILNKLTPENFTVLANQLVSLPIDNMKLLDVVIDQIFTRALSEPLYGNMYALLCKQLNERFVFRREWLERLAASGPAYISSNVLRNRMLRKFQNEVHKELKWVSENEACREKLRNPDLTIEEKAAISEDHEEVQKSKRKSLGSLRFFGELYNQTMITDTIMHRCIRSLCAQKPNPSEEQTESLCTLMTTVGAQLDRSALNECMESYFSFISRVKR